MSLILVADSMFCGKKYSRKEFCTKTHFITSNL